LVQNGAIFVFGNIAATMRSLLRACSLSDFSTRIKSEAAIPPESWITAPKLDRRVKMNTRSGSFYYAMASHIRMPWDDVNDTFLSR